MTEIFDIIAAINRLKDRVDDLDTRIAYLCKYPSLAAFNDWVEEEAACRILHVSKSKIYRMRRKKEIPFFRDQRKILYPVSALEQYLKDHTVETRKSALVLQQNVISCENREGIVYLIAAKANMGKERK
jgi:excisionase family DNA binding protein